MAYGTKAKKEMSNDDISNSELDLENPIFVVYVNTELLDLKHAREKLKLYKKHFTYTNVTTWVIADKSTKVELIWQGYKYSKTPGIIDNNSFEKIINRLNEVIQVISNGTDDETIKRQLRNLKLKMVLNDDTSI